MEYDGEAQVLNFVSGLVLGAMLGAGIALLTAPQAGRKTRKRLKKAAGQIRDDAGGRWDEVSDEVRERVDDAVRSARKRFS